MPESQKFWIEKFEQYRKIFLDLNSDKQIDFVLADPDPKIFTKQIKEADTIFILGGETIRLIKHLENIKNLKSIQRQNHRRLIRWR